MLSPGTDRIAFVGRIHSGIGAMGYGLSKEKEAVGLYMDQEGILQNQ